MIFCTQVRRKTDPEVLHPVVLSIDDIKIKFEQSDGSPSDFLQLRIKVQTDHDADGVPDVADNPLSLWDMEKILYASEDQLLVVDARLRGKGNLMAGIRAFCKARVRVHNEEQAPGGQQETYVDIDDDK